MAFVVRFWVLWWLFYINQTYHCQDTGENVFCQCWKTRFTAFVVCFLALWWLFCVNHLYRCKDTSKKISSPILEPVLLHSPFIIEHFSGCFALIGRSVAKIRKKKFLHRLSNWFYGIHHSYLSTLVDVFCRLYVPLLRYERKLIFAGSEIRFTAFAVHFWALWWLFCINLTCRCQHTGQNISLMTLKPFLWYLLFGFKHFGGCFASIVCTVAKIRAKAFLHWLWNLFYGICSLFFLHFGG